MSVLPPILRFSSVLAIVMASVSFVTPPTLAQADEALQRVADALEGGDPEGVLVDAASRVEVVVFGEGGMYRQGQAEHVLRDFFRRYPPARVAFGEQSSSDEGRTAIGRYWTRDGGSPLSVRVVHRVDGRNWELTGIRIDRGASFRSNR